MTHLLEARMVARLLGGDALRGNRALVPGPGHSRSDRSLSILIQAGAPDGFLAHSHAGDDWQACRDYIKDALGIEHGGDGPPRFKTAPEPDDSERIAHAIAIWNAAVEPAGTPVESYIASRGLPLPAAMRWHPACPFGGSTRTGAMVALVTSVLSNEPQAIHRTALSPEGRKIEVGGYDRLSLGPISGGVVRLSPDEEVTTRLGIGEGIESSWSLRQVPDLQALPVWSALTANGVRSLPIVTRIEALFVAVDQDDAGRSAADDLGERWAAPDRQITFIEPAGNGLDLNDVVMRHAA